MARAQRRVAFSAKSKRRHLPPAKQHSSRDREYLRPDEVEALMKAARRLGRHGERDSAIVLLMFRHGLRTAELVSLKWGQADLKRGYTLRGQQWHISECLELVRQQRPHLTLVYCRQAVQAPVDRGGELREVLIVGRVQRLLAQEAPQSLDQVQIG